MSAKCVKNSLDSIVFSKFDFNHDTENVIGGVLGSKIYNDTDELIPKTPMRLLGYGFLYEDRLKDNWVDVESLTDYPTSFHIEFKDYDFWYKNKVVEKEKAPEEWIMNVKDMIKGCPYYWEGERVNLILGGIDEKAKVTFFANSLLTVQPGDNECGILLAATANKKVALFANKNKGVDKMEKTYTDAEVTLKVQTAIASKEEEVKKVFEPKLEEVKANLAAKDEEINTLKAENEDLKAKYATASETIAGYVVKERKAALAAKGYPEDMLEKKEDFLKTASEEDFNGFVEEFEALATALKPNKTATASKKEEGFNFFNLTVDNDSGEEGEDNVNIFI